MKNQNYKKLLEYRPEIDGLRAISVFSVLLYHAELKLFGINLLPGGYIGVDVFFVISGYLIGKIVLRELKDTSSFSFLGFYKRRAQRILPILAVVMMTTTPFAWIYLTPPALLEYSKSIISTVLFGSNFFFYKVTTAYSADSSLLKPFLHTWSLGVEEQFYVIFPLLAYTIVKLKSNWLSFLLIVCTFFSFFYAAAITLNDNQYSFFMTHTRAWEILIGSLVSMLESKYNHQRNSKYALFGLALIIVSLVSFNENTSHPGFYTLVPVMGASFFYISALIKIQFGFFFVTS